MKIRQVTINKDHEQPVGLEESQRNMNRPDEQKLDGAAVLLVNSWRAST
ncbi:hypothetical protein NNRS527_01846 [Nitrosospira sp. NRS527]|nr:hypothetical protein NNRS527_01846 [Nitrosospira sp. NRS527]